MEDNERKKQTIYIVLFVLISPLVVYMSITTLINSISDLRIIERLVENSKIIDFLELANTVYYFLVPIIGLQFIVPLQFILLRKILTRKKHKKPNQNVAKLWWRLTLIIAVVVFLIAPRFIDIHINNKIVNAGLIICKKYSSSFKHVPGKLTRIIYMAQDRTCEDYKRWEQEVTANDTFFKERPWYKLKDN